MRCLSGDAPVKEMLQDLAGEAWDLVILNETWRDAEEECFKVDAGHAWSGSGGDYEFPVLQLRGGGSSFAETRTKNSWWKAEVDDASD